MNNSELENSMMTVIYKFVFVGDVGVVKTSIMNKFKQFRRIWCKNKYIKIYIMIIFKKIVNGRSRFLDKNYWI